MSLHADIMNMKVSGKTAAHIPSAQREFYFLGVRDARHAAAELALTADSTIEELDALRERMADILSRTAVALRGPEPPLTRWSWHDLPELAAAAVAAAKPQPEPPNDGPK
jgi:hypothetical protein